MPRLAIYRDLAAARCHDVPHHRETHARPFHVRGCRGGTADSFDTLRHVLPPAGCTIANLFPCPGSLSTVISPPCAATMCRTIARPTPDPFTFAVAAAVPRTALILCVTFCLPPAAPSQTSFHAPARYLP